MPVHGDCACRDTALAIEFQTSEGRLWKALWWSWEAVKEGFPFVAQMIGVWEDSSVLGLGAWAVDAGSLVEILVPPPTSWEPFGKMLTHLQPQFADL